MGCDAWVARVEIEGSTCVTIPPVRMGGVTHEAATTLKNTCGNTERPKEAVSGRFFVLRLQVVAFEFLRFSTLRKVCWA